MPTVPPDIKESDLSGGANLPFEKGWMNDPLRLMSKIAQSEVVSR
jgi:hypothetical protein